jgi:hypothetical protein
MKDKAKAKLISQYLKNKYQEDRGQKYADRAAQLKEQIEER